MIGNLPQNGLFWSLKLVISLDINGAIGVLSVSRSGSFY